MSLHLCFCPLEGIGVCYYDDTLPGVLPSVKKSSTLDSHGISTKSQGVVQFSPAHRFWIKIEQGSNLTPPIISWVNFLTSPRSLLILDGGDITYLIELLTIK